MESPTHPCAARAHQRSDSDYNSAAFLAEALESIRAQTVPVTEVIAVDDESADDSVAIASSHTFVTVVRKKHGGASDTLNRGLDVATGDYFAFLDADDRWLPDKISLQMAAFAEDPELGAVFGHIRQFRSAETSAGRVEQVLATVPGVHKNSLLIKRAAFERAGRFCASGDHDFLGWYLRAHGKHLRTKMLPEPLAERRIHGSNYGLLHREKQRRTYLAALKANLDRRRAALAAAGSG